MKVPNRINGYKATQPPAPVKPAATSGARITNETQRGVAAAVAAAPAAAASTADTVNITGSGLALQRLGEAVANAPVVDVQKVATVKQAVIGGAYQVDTVRVADKIIQFETGLQ
jgi:negative regulator of flagellin synthesis FlgM